MPPDRLPDEPLVVPLDEREMAVMRAFGRMMLVMPRMLDADLERDQRMSLSEYSVLRHLSESEGGIMRMSELAVACDMSLSGMTRLAGKLESLGYLTRRRCETDGRGLDVILTDAGLARLQEAWPAHLASVRRRIFDHLGDVDLVHLARALEAMTG
ncbi:MarR family winged helix-turn-helix transcriptional regulator [Actinoplanes sp. NPDC051494]|uniref:MarR family winged helix-turn-helix transcriptional regulator n=1 Tax=Actinoplanes sp. NPDC051494 TaxID=3363907 RepID=UPI00379C06F9